jgi:hypothetical protein
MYLQRLHLVTSAAYDSPMRFDARGGARALLARALCLALGGTLGCGYAWAPQGQIQNWLHTPTISDPDQIALAYNETVSGRGAGGKVSISDFAIVDGTGHQLSPYEMVDRYTRRVGHDDVTPILKNNQVWWTAGFATLAMVFGGGAAAAANAAGKGSTFTGDAEAFLIVGGALAALIVLWEAGTDPRSSGKMTYAQAQVLVARYNEHPGEVHPAPPTAAAVAPVLQVARGAGAN